MEREEMTREDQVRSDLKLLEDIVEKAAELDRDNKRMLAMLREQFDALDKVAALHGAMLAEARRKLDVMRTEALNENGVQLQ